MCLFLEKQASPSKNMTDPKGGSLSVADAAALKAELATMRENLTASTALNEARDIEMKALIAAKSAQDSSTSLAAKAQETKEVQLREQLTASTSKLETLVRDNDSLRSKAAASQLGSPAHTQVSMVDGFAELLRTQGSLLDTTVTIDDTWAVLVEKQCKRLKLKNSRGELLLKIDPLRVAHPDILSVVVAWLAIIDQDPTGSAVELLMSKITLRFQFSNELVEEVGLLLLAVQRTCQVTAAGKKPSEKLTALAEVMTVLQRRIDWLEQRLTQRGRHGDTAGSTSPPKRVALRGDHF